MVKSDRARPDASFAERTPRFRARVAFRSGARLARFAGACLALALLAACAPATPPVAPAEVGARGGDAARVELPRLVVTPGGAEDLGETLARARAARDAGRLGESLDLYARVAELGGESEDTLRALLESATLLDEAAHHDDAAARYLELARRFPGREPARTALVRAVRLLAFRERYAEAGAAADLVLPSLGELSPAEQVVVLSGKALALVTAEDPEPAAYFVGRGRDVAASAGLDREGRIPRDLAQLYFALGELRRRRGEAIDLHVPPSRFTDALERRCQALLDAQSAYADAMRAEDAHWSAMSGYRVGELYQRLHAELVRLAPPPGPDLTAGRRELFEGALRLRYSVLLRKGRAMMEHTVALGRRTGQPSTWVDRAAAALADLTRAAEEEDAAVARLGVRREDLESVLRDLGTRAGARSASTPATPGGPAARPDPAK